jgi:ABC-type multidrug transport system ATPase subunit
MIRTMTVEETIRFSAKTRCADMSNEEINDRVNYVIKTLGLEDVRNSEIGDEDVRGVSGGERKRVNVGIELVTYPSILFLDEVKIYLIFF